MPLLCNMFLNMFIYFFAGVKVAAGKDVFPPAAL